MGFASLESSELDTNCVPHAEDVPFLFEQTDEKNVIGRAFLSKFLSRLLWPALQSSSWSCLNISTTPRAPGWGMRPGRAVRLLLPWERSGETKESGAGWRSSNLGASYGKGSENSGCHCRRLTSTVDASPSRSEPGSSSSHLHGCLCCLPLPSLQPTLSDISKYFFFTVILSIMVIYL